MMKNSIWVECEGEKQIKKIETKAWRIVEAQHSSSTRKLVDSVAEHEVLEQLIDSVKPALHPHLKKLDYLYFTPFRYPPLKYGSRFGTKLERSVWYGSLTLHSALAETAFYRFAFLKASTAPINEVKTWHTAFNASIKTPQGIDLTKLPFSKYKKLISSPTDYEISQSLGTTMRENEVQAFLYSSARDKEKGINIGIFYPEAFAKKHPEVGSFQTWECYATQTSVEFARASSMQKEIKLFPIEDFLVANVLPFPAT